MEFLKRFLGKVGTGFSYGIGFGIIIIAISWGSSLYFEKKADEIMSGESDGENCRDFKKCEESSGLEIKITKERISKTDFVLLGKVKNSGDIKWTSAKIKAELFDEEGNFIDECTESVNQKISPNTEVNFKLSCSSCSKVNLDNYKSYKAFIIDGNTW